MKNFKFKKSFGQNFINEKKIIERIVNDTEIKENSLVIEIGPGSGVLTRELAKVAKNVLAYEIDERLEDILDENLKDYNNIQIIYDDFLKRNVNRDIEIFSYQNVYVVANIPYYITTAIIIKLIETKLPFEKITIMIQKEVGERFTARVGTREYGSITVFLNYYFDVKKLFLVSRNCFTPKPNVDSIVISLCHKGKMEYVLDEELFFKLIKDAFHFKRKNLRNNLKNYDLKLIEMILQKNQKDLTCRAEELDYHLFIEIANALSEHN